jgi:hypothetical protein
MPRQCEARAQIAQANTGAAALDEQMAEHAAKIERETVEHTERLAALSATSFVRTGLRPNLSRQRSKCRRWLRFNFAKAIWSAARWGLSLSDNF